MTQPSAAGLSGIAKERGAAHPPAMIEGEDVRLDSTIIKAASLDELSAVNRPSSSLALCPREMSPALSPWLDGLPEGALPNGRILVRKNEAPVALAALFASSSLPEDDLSRELRNDMVELIERFAAIAGVPEVDVRVERIRHDACKRFHRDHVRMRLICCYRGPTTEWVPGSHAEDALDLQGDYSGPLRHFPRYAVAVFKGHQHGVVHRSPPIAGSGITRLLLCLNERSTASPPLWRPA
ncbi:MAG: DUF1826 domain-containing protein [Pseudomonadota bacterium]